MLNLLTMPSCSAPGPGSQIFLVNPPLSLIAAALLLIGIVKLTSQVQRQKDLGGGMICGGVLVVALPVLRSMLGFAVDCDQPMVVERVRAAMPIFNAMAASIVTLLTVGVVWALWLVLKPQTADKAGV